MAFKKRSTNGRKAYFWRAVDMGNGMSVWCYVSADTPAAVEVSGYFDDAELISTVQVGDEIRAYQVAAIDDTRTVQQDIAAGLTDYSRHLVVTNSGSAIDITPDLEGATVTYTV